ncbi:MAG: hypothetical protein QM758_14700 [Armatimonas sp.]
MKRVVTILALAIFICLPTQARRCFVGDRSIAERIHKAQKRGKIIFYARALFSKEDSNGTSTTLLVEQAWSPGVPHILTVSIDRFGESPYLEIGHSYTVFAASSSYSKLLFIPGCGLTREGLPEEYRTVLGPGHRVTDIANVWWGMGSTLWLATFGFLRLRRFRKHFL